MSLAQSLPKQLMKSDELPGDLEARDETIPPPSSAGDPEHVLLTGDSPEDSNAKLSLGKDRSVQVFSPPYLPYYKTSCIHGSPSSLAASHISTETEESFNDGKVSTKHNEAVATGYFSCYRTYKELHGQPVTYGLNTEEKKADETDGGCAQDVGDAEKTIPSSLESDKRALPSVGDQEPPAPQLLRDSNSELSPPTISSSELPVLNQTFSFSGYFPYYRTEGKLCPDPILDDRFLTGTEDLENTEVEQGGETSIWDLCASCVMC